MIYFDRGARRLNPQYTPNNFGMQWTKKLEGVTVETKTLSLTDEIYAELVDGLKTGLDWTQFLAEHGASKGPLYNAIGRFFNDMEPKVRALNEVQAQLDQVGLKLNQLNQEISEADKAVQTKNQDLALLEEKENTLKKQTEVLESNLEQKSTPLKRLQELEKLGFGEERLKALCATLAEIGTKRGLKRDEAVNTFFAELKDYDAKTGFEQEIQRLETIIRTKTLEAEKWQAEADSLSRQHKDLTEAIAAVQDLGRQGVKAEQVVYWNGIASKIGDPEQLQDKLEWYYGIFKAAGFDEKALGELTKAAEKYGTPRKVLTALNSFGNLSEIKAATEETQGKEKQRRAILKDLEEKHSHLKSAIEMCQKLMQDHKFGLDTITSLLATAKMYGEPIRVLKAIEAYGALKEIKKETDQAKTALAEIKEKVEAEKETYAECNARTMAVLDHLEALTAKAIEVGQQVGSIQEQIKKDSLARDILNLLQNPTSAGYEDCLPLVLVTLNSISLWANMNKGRFTYFSLLDRNLKEAIGSIGGS